LNLELTSSSLLASFRSQLNSLHPQTSSTRKILLAYSGGLDSHVLLHLLSQFPRDEFILRAVYINHGLQSQSVEWAVHCQQQCQKLNIPFSNIDLNLDISKGESLEEVARNARYQALHDQLQRDEILITAHHQGDQAETLLLQLFRGAGVQGLSAMPVLNEINIKDGYGYHLRPLLNQSRAALQAYANQHNLQHIEDPSNQDTSFDRNFLRQEIMPLLHQRWLGLDKALSRSAELQAESKSLLDEMAQLQLPDVLSSELSQYTDDNMRAMVLAPIVIPKLLEHGQAKQRLLLRHWIVQQGFANPSAKKLKHIFSDCIGAASDKQPVIEWQGAELRRFKQHLYIMQPLSKHDAAQVIPWQLDQALYISSINVTLNPELLGGNRKNVTVRFRQGGETIEIKKRGNISLKNLFQEQQVPTWLRSRLPLIYTDEKLIKIVGLHASKGTPPLL